LFEPPDRVVSLGLWGDQWALAKGRYRPPLRCAHDPSAWPAIMTAASGEQVAVLLFSNRDEVRAQVRNAVGRRPAPDSPRIEWVECSKVAQVLEQLAIGEIELVILDGEAQPTGGMGLARQFKYELDDCPPIVVLVARAQDGWLASWSLADAVISRPLDPVAAAATVAEQLRNRISGIPVVR
jgi:DNA-binding NtrC family response regulator